MQGCGALTEAYSSETALRVVTSAVQGGVECGEGPGNIERFEATLLETGATQNVACGEDVVFGSLEGGVAYNVELFGFAKSELFPTWGTTCFRTAQPGAIVEAGCTTLLASGSMAVETSSVVAALGESCGPSGIVTVSGDILVTGNPKSVPCGAAIRFSGLEPKSYGIRVRTQRADGSAGPTAICDAVVVPGIARRASCQPE